MKSYGGKRKRRKAFNHKISKSEISEKGMNEKEAKENFERIHAKKKDIE